MKKIITLILITVSLNCLGQGVDTAAQRKKNEVNKFISELVSKTSIKDFREWLYESNTGVKDFEAFNKMYNEFIRQKYLADKGKK